MARMRDSSRAQYRLVDAPTGARLVPHQRSLAEIQVERERLETTAGLRLLPYMFPRIGVALSAAHVYAATGLQRDTMRISVRSIRTVNRYGHNKIPDFRLKFCQSISGFPVIVRFSEENFLLEKHNRYVIVPCDYIFREVEKNCFEYSYLFYV